MKISEMRDSVNKKRIELEFLRRSKTLSSILDAQVRLPILLNATFINLHSSPQSNVSSL